MIDKKTEISTTELILLPFQSKNRNIAGSVYGGDMVFITLIPEIVIDVDSNVYNSIVIGALIWMKENLKTSKYNDGTPIPNITDNIEWAGLSAPCYCW